MAFAEFALLKEEPRSLIFFGAQELDFAAKAVAKLLRQGRARRTILDQVPRTHWSE